MKKIISFSVLILFLFSCKSTTTNNRKPFSFFKKPTYEVLDANEVNTAEKKKVYELGKRVLNTCNTSKFKPFTEKEATQEIIQKMTVDKISATCKQMIRGYGKFQDLEFIEAIHITKTNETLYRFKCDYEKKYNFKELQITVNDKGQICLFQTKNWSEAFEGIK